MKCETVALFSVVLMSVTFIFGNGLRLAPNPINNNVKRSLGYHEESMLNFTEISERYGYTSKEHTVVTEDGYILTIFRINGRNCSGKLRSPVILMHGVLQSADAWLDAGPNAGLAYLISDACYDLWVGNQRGNYYSRRHVRLDPDKDSEFWNFSADEIGFYDLPATIDYVLKFTGEEKLNYIGYSQGVNTYFIMCSERPGYCNKANVFIALSPPSKLVDMKSVPFKFMLGLISQVEGVLAAGGIYEIFTRGSNSPESFDFLCKITGKSEDICETGLFLLDSYHPGSVTNETLMRSYGHYPAGTSVHTLAWYGQKLKSQRFRKFDYGKVRNMEIYGEEQPPDFDLSAVTVPVVALYGNNDSLVGKEEVMSLVEQLPRVLEVVEVSDPQWNHLDMVYSQFTKELIFPKINEYLLKYSEG